MEKEKEIIACVCLTETGSNMATLLENMVGNHTNYHEFESRAEVNLKANWRLNFTKLNLKMINFCCGHVGVLRFLMLWSLILLQSV